MPQVDFDFKQFVASVQGTPTIKLIALLMAQGITTTDDLVEATGLKIRAVQSAKKTIADLNNADASAAQCAQQNAHAQHSAPKAQQNAQNAAECALPLARAYKENPSGLNITNKLSNTPLSPPKVIPLKPKRGCRLNENWVLPDEWLVWSQTNFPAASIEKIKTEADKFRDYWIAKPGAQACKLDWQATWRNWCRTGLSEAGMRKPQHTAVWKQPDQPKESWDDIMVRAHQYAEQRA